ncbi:MAG: hypothetical protein NTZ09_08685 [Candidatus Hydrogenedentes bacterium]|nr:hypothetical protein [Candidatus Hydrogenedentota bacterium]
MMNDESDIYHPIRNLQSTICNLHSSLPYEEPHFVFGPVLLLFVCFAAEGWEQEGRADCRLSIADCRLPIGVPIADCRLAIVDWRLSIVDC